MSPTLKDIAQHCSTSVSTVSHVLNGRPGTYIGEATRQRVLDAARQLGYRPNQIARNLRNRRSMTIGVITGGLDIETHADKLAAILGAASENGYAATVAMAGGTSSSEVLGRFLAAQVEGIIVASFALRIDSDDLAEAKKTGVPVVAIDPAEECDLTVRADRFEAGRLAAGHLLDLGRRNIVFAGGSASGYFAEAERHRGFRAAHEERGLDCGDDRFVPLGDGADAAVSAITGRDERPDGIVALSDETAIALLGSLRRQGASVPGDVAIVGYNDIRLASHVTPALTTVGQPDEEIGAAAVEMLFGAIGEARSGGEVTPREQVFEPKLIVRESCGGGMR